LFNLNFLHDFLPAGIAGSIITAFLAIVCVVAGTGLFVWARRRFSSDSPIVKMGGVCRVVRSIVARCVPGALCCGVAS
jgi:hypothetical protein